MADVSQCPESQDCAEPTKLPEDVDWKLINIEPADDGFQLDILDVPSKGKQPPYDADPCPEELHLEGISGPNVKAQQIKTELCHSCEPGLDCQHLALSTQDANHEQNEHEELTRSWLELDWRLINIEPTVQAEYVRSEEENFENAIHLAQPGPSSVRGQNSCDSSGLIKECQSEWKQTGVEPCSPQVSSISRRCEEDLPGPSRTRVYSTILKKSCLDRQPPHSEENVSVRSEQLKSNPDSHPWYLDNEDHCHQSPPFLRQSSEKENQKRVHFDPRSDCELLHLCDRGWMGCTPDTKYPSAREMMKKLTSDDERENDEQVLLGSTRGVFHSHAFESGENDSGSNKGVSTKATMKRNVSIALNENTSANNSPTEDKPNRVDKDSIHHNETGAQHQSLLRIGSRGTATHQTELSDNSIGIRKSDATLNFHNSIDQLCNKVASDSENSVNISVHNDVMHETEEKPVSHTGKMVALFTNLNVTQTSPPLQTEKPKRVRSPEGKVADYIHCFDERVSKNPDKQCTPLAPEKTHKAETVCTSKPGTYLQSSNLCPQTSRKEVQNVERLKERTRMLSTNKQSVEAVLLVLKSMQSILVRMAKIANSRFVGSSEIDDLLRDPLKIKRKKHPWMSACPKDSEVMPDGLFAYSIAHQVIGQAFRKITELYPTCTIWEQLDSDPERDFVDRNSASVLLALTAMKDALRELEGQGVCRLYTSTAVETSDSLTSVSTGNMSDDQDVENKAYESRSTVLDIIDEVLDHVINNSINDRRSMNQTDPKPTSNRAGTAKEDSANAELKKMSFELVSRTVRDAISILMTTKPQSMSDTACDRTQALSVQKLQTCNGTASDTENLNWLGSAVNATLTPQEDDQPAISLVQSISNEIYCLISKLFSHLESADCREKEKLNVLITDVKKEMFTAVDLVHEKSNVLEKELNLTSETVEESSPVLLSTTEQRKTDLQMNTTDSAYCQEYGTPNISVEMRCNNTESQPIVNDTNYLSCAAQKEVGRKTEKWNALSPSPEKDSQNTESEPSRFGEPCRSNESTKCINSSSQTTNSSIERLFDMNIETPRPRLTSENQFRDDTNSQQTFEYSTPSTLFGMQTGEDSREGNLGMAGFGNLHIVHSSDLIVIPATLLQMSGGNHPEHVQQADRNRPSCSGSPTKDGNPQRAEKASTSRSVTIPADRKKKPGCWDTTCGANSHHQTRSAKGTGSMAGKKHSHSEPKLDFYKRTKLLECPRARREQFDSPESNISEWSVLGFFPPRHVSEIAGPDEEESEAGDNVCDAEFEEGRRQVDSEIHGTGHSSLQDSVGAQASSVSDNEDEPGCLSTETDVFPHVSSEHYHSLTCSVNEKQTELVTQIGDEESFFHAENKENNPENQIISKDDVISFMEVQPPNWQGQGKSLYLDKSRFSPHNHSSSAQALATCQLCDTANVCRRMPLSRCFSDPPSTRYPSSAFHSKCQKMPPSANVHSCHLKRERSSTHLDDRLLNPSEDLLHKSNQPLTCPHCAGSPSSKHSCCKLTTGTDHSKRCHCEQARKNPTTPCYPLVSPVSQSSGYASSIQPVDSETEQNYSSCRSCTQESRKGSYKRSSSMTTGGVCRHTNMKYERAPTSVCGKCASLDSQLRISNKNINGTGRGIRTTASKIKRSSASFSGIGQESAVNRVEDKFSQLQTRLKVGVDHLKDYMIALCSSLTIDNVPGEEETPLKSVHQSRRLAKSCSCLSSSVPHRMPGRFQSCDRHLSSGAARPSICCICHCSKNVEERCEENPSTVDPSRSHCLRNRSCSCAGTCPCSCTRSSLSAPPRGPKQMADICMAADKSDCCGPLRKMVHINACPCHSVSVPCAGFPHFVCLYPLSGSTASSHSSKPHRVRKRKHTTSAKTTEQTRSEPDINSYPDYCSHNRKCKLHEACSTSVDTDRLYWTTNSSCKSRNKMENCDSESILCDKEEGVPESQECEHSITTTQGEQNRVLRIDSHNELTGEDAVDQRQPDTAEEKTGTNCTAFCRESIEPSIDRARTGDKERVCRAVDINHSYRVTQVSSNVVDTAMSFLETLLKIHKSNIADPKIQPDLCHRVASSSVDCETPSGTMTQSANMTEKAESKQHVHNICSSVLHDLEKHTLDYGGSKHPARSGHLLCKSGSLSENNSDCAKQNCTCQDRPSQECCSNASVFCYEQCRWDRSLAPGRLCEQLEARHKCSGCETSDEQNADTCSVCSEIFSKLDKIFSAETNNENKSNSSPSKYSTFLVCLGEDDASSALVIRPVIPPKAVQVRDSACQAGNENVCTRLERFAIGAERGNSEMSVASSSISTGLEGENQDPVHCADQKSSGLRGAVVCSSPSSSTDRGCDSFFSIAESVCTTRVQSRSSSNSGSTQRKRSSLQKIESKTSSQHTLEGTCEISHSGCETCLKPSALQSGNVSALQSGNVALAKYQDVEKPVTQRSETKMSDTVRNDPTDNGCPFEIRDLSESNQTSRISNTNTRTNSFSCTEHWDNRKCDFSKTNDPSTVKDGAVDRVCELGSKGMNTSETAENVSLCRADSSNSGEVDPRFLREDFQGGPILLGVSCKSSHVDPSFTCTGGVTLNHTESFCSETCVDTSILDGGSYDIVSDVNRDHSSMNIDTNREARAGNDHPVEVNGSSLGENHNEKLKGMRYNVDYPACAENIRDSAGGDLNFPADFNQPQRVLSSITGRKEGKDISETDTGSCLSLSTSQSYFPTDVMKDGSPRKHASSPCTSMGSLSTTAVTSSSSAADQSPSSSPVDPLINLCRSTMVCSASSGSTASTLDCEESFSAGEVARDQRPDRTHAAGFASGSTDSFHEGLVKSLETAVKRSQIGELLSNEEAAEQGGTRDSWVSLQLLNLSSRATRLAIESRVQSLQRILNKMEICAKSPPSVSVAASKQQPYSCSHSATGSLTTVAEAGSPGDHWLRACSSEELVQMIHQQLEGLKSSTDLQKRLQSSSIPESDPCRGNTNTNHRLTRNACTNISSDTQSTGTITDISGQVAFTHSRCVVEKFGIDVSASDSGVKIDILRYSDVFNTGGQSRENVNVDFHDEKSHTASQIDRVEGVTNVNRISINGNCQADATPRAAEIVSGVCVSEVVTKGLTLDANDVKDDAMNCSDSFGASEGSGVVEEKDLRMRSVQLPNSFNNIQLTENDACLETFDGIGKELGGICVCDKDNGKRADIVSVESVAGSKDSHFIETESGKNYDQIEPFKKFLCISSGEFSGDSISRHDVIVSEEEINGSDVKAGDQWRTVIRKNDNTHRMIHEGKQSTDKSWAWKHKITVNTHFKPCIFRNKSQVSRIFSQTGAEEKYRPRTFQNSKQRSNPSYAPLYRNTVPKSRAFLKVKSFPSNIFTQIKSTNESSSAGCGGDEGSSNIYVEHVRELAKEPAEVKSQEQREASGRAVLEKENSDGARASVEEAVENAGKGLRVEDEGNEDGLTDRLSEGKIFPTNIGVQCNIRTSSAHNHKLNLSGFDHASKRSKSEETRSALRGVFQPEEEGMEKRHRDRVRSLEQALELERDLHRITRSSLTHLVSDHHRFRQQMLTVQSRGNHRASEHLHEIRRRADE